MTIRNNLGIFMAALTSAKRMKDFDFIAEIKISSLIGDGDYAQLIAAINE